jgi:hypothetical protein
MEKMNWLQLQRVKEGIVWAEQLMPLTGCEEGLQVWWQKVGRAWAALAVLAHDPQLKVLQMW